ncbi:hypothetical protein BN1013_02116 [Candidatus Rubidus massiliensis]|nr:hypothetical protein BN1013_02116 [Candidatus Rubidus massiliensis]
MKESLKKYWNLYLALILLILGMFFYGRSYGNEHYNHNSECNALLFPSPLLLHNKCK